MILCSGSPLLEVPKQELKGYLSSKGISAVSQRLCLHLITESNNSGYKDVLVSSFRVPKILRLLKTSDPL